MALRANAALVLGEIKGAQAVQPLIWALDDEEIIVRLNAAVSLGKLGDVRAAIPLAKAMKEGNQDVRHRAYDALVKLGVNLGEVTTEMEAIEIVKMRSELERERIHLEMAKIKNEKTKFVESMEAPPNEEIDDEQKPSVVQNITYNIQDSAISGDIKATGLKKKDD